MYTSLLVEELSLCYEIGFDWIVNEGGLAQATRSVEESVGNGIDTVRRIHATAIEAIRRNVYPFTLKS